MHTYEQFIFCTWSAFWGSAERLISNFVAKKDILYAHQLTFNLKLWLYKYFIGLQLGNVNLTKNSIVSGQLLSEVLW